MVRIQLERSAWTYDVGRPLGKPGGFGAVFAGASEDGSSVAIKRLHLTREAAGHREMEMAAALARRDLRHVLPVLDWGADLDTGAYYVVMPLAEGSLAQAVRSGAPEAEALDVLAQIANGLAELPDIVHRDLKPDNVLRHEGRWKLADFGIARFVEESTSANTLKECLSAYYAAPEQWNLQRATAATDVYALGCIAYALLTGAPPFSGRTLDELRNKHLSEAPPPLPGSPRLRALVSASLKKSPGVRPSVSRVIAELGQIAAAAAQPPSAIAAAAAVVASKESESEARAGKEQARVGERRRLAADGADLLRELSDRLFDEIASESPLVQRLRGDSRVSLGEGELSVSVRFPYIERAQFPHCGWDVAAGALVRVAQRSGQYKERSANLWFADREGKGEFRWYEVGLWSMWTRPTRSEPFGISSPSEMTEVDGALSPAIGGYEVTPRPVRAIDGSDEAWFVRRWKAWFAQAATGSLSRPGGMPE